MLYKRFYLASNGLSVYTIFKSHLHINLNINKPVEFYCDKPVIHNTLMYMYIQCSCFPTESRYFYTLHHGRRSWRVLTIVENGKLKN